MPKNARLNGGSDAFELGFVEREQTPRELMRLSIELHTAGLSLSDTVSVLEKFGINRCRSTVHNWVQKADLQPTGTRSWNYVAFDETVIQLGTERYWLMPFPAAMARSTAESGSLISRLNKSTNSTTARS